MPPPKAARLSPSLQVFFSLESYAENSELFLQALLIHAAPRKNRTKDADGNTLDTASLPPLSTALAAKTPPLCRLFPLPSRLRHRFARGLPSGSSGSSSTRRTLT